MAADGDPLVDTASALLTHLDRAGHARMVDVSDKDVTRREAVAACAVSMRPDTLRMILDGTAPKGDVLATARIAGIMAAKRTADLIPLCHPLPLSGVAVSLVPAPGGTGVMVKARVRTTDRTGVEMEALTAASVAALTLYDMCKAVDRGMRIGDLRVVEKSGGRSGTYREEAAAALPRDGAGGSPPGKGNER
ncbi:cyclic pyranopterin monophosphate synthase MoaC [Rhizosaccharibacter radicis]|uniref:Cyclic pyranopterin monophosphate synthase n=1 Tax=Rhizosaccharibacter radicis TaxID=2782605 RepID=A0ABT1VWB9_9PROT|nr:cyclic pyranopterin monophosphate synthase MoaC [Acetobacteraceae bacterium KSS12]